MTLTLVLGAHQSPSVPLETSGKSFRAWPPGYLGAGLFMPIWALYAFEGGGRPRAAAARRGDEGRRPDGTQGDPRLPGRHDVGHLRLFISTKDPVTAMSATSPIQDNIGPPGATTAWPRARRSSCPLPARP